MNQPSTSTDVHLPRPESASAIETIFGAILKDIVTGVHVPGARLPAERELSRTLGASRPTLREALRRLTEWRLIEPRRGSGIVVRPVSEWSIEVLPAFLRHARPAGEEPAVSSLLADLLALRRSLTVEIVQLVADRIPAEAVARPRAAAEQAWAVRHDPQRFQVEDLLVLRSMVEAAQFLPALWLLNRLAGVYLEVARSLSSHFEPPDDYLEIHQRMMDAIEQRDSKTAVSILREYLDRHDRQLLDTLGAGA
jgi:GntR family transcriptional regulator, transcriptional repressor for pyruvate dehydrogenase complex